MEKNISQALIDAHPALAVVQVRIDRKSKKVTLSCEEYPFRLMFATGPNFQVSCRYNLGKTRSPLFLVMNSFTDLIHRIYC